MRHGIKGLFMSLKLFKQSSISKPDTTCELGAARKLHLAVLAAIALSAPLHSLSAAEVQNEEEAIDTLPAVTVSSSAPDETATGPVEGYVAKRSATATKTDTPLIETPQSVTVVTSERIRDQGATNVQDALNYAAGVRSDAFGLDSRTDSVYIRGSFPDQYLDGLRQNFNFYTSTTRVDPYMLERIEVLRGPAAMLYGQGSTAGIVNLVSKRPLAETQREIGVQLGSFNRKQVQADLTGPLTEDGTWLYRLVAIGRDSETQVDHVDDDRVLFAPSLTWRPNDDTSLTVLMRYQKDESGSTAQFFPWSGSVLRNPNGRIDTDTFIGEPGFDRYDSENFSIGWQFEHRLNEHWKVRQNVRFTDNEVDYRTLYADSFTNPGNSYLDPNQRIIGRYGQSTLTKVRMVTTDQHLVGDFSTGPVQHKLLLGLDALRFSQRQDSAFDSPVGLGGTIPNIDVYNPVYTGYASPPQTEDPKTSQEQIGFYIQDQMKLDNWILVAGLRRDVALSNAEGSPTDRSEATSGRLGLMYAFDNGWSPYVSYSESFTPVLGANTMGQRFDPLEGKQKEIGLKVQPPGKNYTFTAAAFELRETNRLFNGSSIFLQEQAGDTETKGLELEWLGDIGGGRNISAHYNYIDNDRKLDEVPQHQAAIWGTQQFSLGGITGFSAGLGVRYFSEFTDKTGSQAAPETPSVTLADALLAWDNGQYRYALNVMNIADKEYVSACLSRGDCFYGARRTALFTATYRF